MTTKKRMDLMALRECLGRPVDEFFPAWFPKETRYKHIDNGSRILGVCHVDTVCPVSSQLFISKDGGTLYGSNFDDRLGYFVLMHLLPSIGINLDVLVCDHEEMGRSTGKYFLGADKYDLVVEFDRAGADYVDYGFGSVALDDSLKKHGFKKAHGSFSDISTMNTEVARVNIGIGYHKAHSVKSEMSPMEFWAQMNRFISWYTEYIGAPVRYLADDPYGLSEFSRGWYDSWRDDWDKSDSKGSRNSTLTPWYCDQCGTLLTSVYECEAYDPKDTEILYVCKECKEALTDSHYGQYWGEA